MRLPFFVIYFLVSVSSISVEPAVSSRHLLSWNIFGSNSEVFFLEFGFLNLAVCRIWQ